jgi:hypothetical protein
MIILAFQGMDGKRETVVPGFGGTAEDEAGSKPAPFAKGAKSAAPSRSATHFWEVECYGNAEERDVVDNAGGEGYRACR